MNTPEITCQELAEKLKEKSVILIDVRQPEEYEICKIKGSILIPLHTLPLRINELDKNKSYVMQCKSGGRSANATQFMLQNGFTQVWNLKGGIIAWACEIDRSVAVY